MATMYDLTGLGCTEEEAMKVLSSSYVNAARVCQAAEDKFVVFSMHKGNVVGVGGREQLGELTAEAIKQSAEGYRATVEAERKVEIVEASAEELGL